MKVTAIRTSGLGDASYLLTHGGAGVVVDPQRDVERFLSSAVAAEVEITHVLETHLHNDYLSGGRELAKRTGANLVLPASAGAAFGHTAAFHNEEFDAGLMVVRPLHTPGHTPEHVSYLVIVDGEPMALFSGGSLLVGSAGRPDLLGSQRATQLARLQYGSVMRLAELPGDTGLYPTHGEGSFCTSVAAGRSTSTIGVERKSNVVLQYEDADAFVEGQLRGLQPFPSYYAYLGPKNLLGPDPMPTLQLAELEAVDVPVTASLVDIRPRASFAAGHIPGSIGLEMGDRVGVWAGWLLPFDAAVVIVAEPGQDVAEVATQFARIGFDHVLGVLYNVVGWAAINVDLVSFVTRTADQLFEALATDPPPQILDVRAPGDWEIGSINGSIFHYTPDLKDRLPEGLDFARDVWVVCGTGFRAMAASTYLEEGGFRPVVVTEGGVADILERTAGEKAV